jgi:SAM-dependent methyltransferase
MIGKRLEDVCSHVRDVWETRAVKDPLFTVLTTRDESIFWQAGEDEIAGIEREGLLAPDHSVLDFGCGVGRLSIPLARRVKSVVSADVAPEMLRQLKIRAASSPNIKPLLVAPGGPIEGKFDLVVSFLVFQHMQTFSARRTLSRFREVLKPGGRVVIDLPVLEWETQRDFSSQLWARVPLGELWESRYYHESEIDSLLMEPAGLEVERIVRTVRDRPILILREREQTAASRSRAILHAWRQEIGGVLTETKPIWRLMRLFQFGLRLTQTRLEELMSYWQKTTEP